MTLLTLWTHVNSWNVYFACTVHTHWCIFEHLVLVKLCICIPQNFIWSQRCTHQLISYPVLEFLYAFSNSLMIVKFTNCEVGVRVLSAYIWMQACCAFPAYWLIPRMMHVCFSSKGISLYAWMVVSVEAVLVTLLGMLSPHSYHRLKESGRVFLTAWMEEFSKAILFFFILWKGLCLI